jgi:hypothetical protein
MGEFYSHGGRLSVRISLLQLETACASALIIIGGLAPVSFLTLLLLPIR